MVNSEVWVDLPLVQQGLEYLVISTIVGNESLRGLRACLERDVGDSLLAAEIGQCDPQDSHPYHRILVVTIHDRASWLVDQRIPVLDPQNAFDNCELAQGAHVLPSQGLATIRSIRQFTETLPTIIRIASQDHGRCNGVVARCA